MLPHCRKKQVCLGKWMLFFSAYNILEQYFIEVIAAGEV